MGPQRERTPHTPNFSLWELKRAAPFWELKWDNSLPSLPFPRPLPSQETREAPRPFGTSKWTVFPFGTHKAALPRGGPQRDPRSFGTPSGRSCWGPQRASSRSTCLLTYLLAHLLTYLFKALRAFRHADIIEKEYALRRYNIFVSEKGYAIRR